MFDPSFKRVNKLFILSFESKDDRKVNTKNYLSVVDIKNHNVMINGKFFDQSVKTNLGTYDRQIRKIGTGQGDDCITSSLLDFN